MHKRIYISLKVVLLSILIFSKLNTFAWTVQVAVNGIKYEIYITGEKNAAVADSALVGWNCEIHDYWINPSYHYYNGETANIASSVTYSYIWYELVGYDQYSNPIYKERTKYLTAPVIGIKDMYTSTSGYDEYYAFAKSSNLKSVHIPNTVKYIGSYAFAYCPKLTHIDIPSSVTTIGRNAFSNCTGLTSVTIPNSVTSIGSSAFSNCTGLTSVTIPNSVTSIGNSAFSYCTGLKSATISNSVIDIGSYAFNYCSGMKDLTLGKSVTYIRNYAFYGCNSLNNIYSKSEIAPSMDDTYCFNYNTYYSATVYVPIGAKRDYELTNYWNKFNNIIEMDMNETPPGDTNGDGEVNIADINALINVILSGDFSSVYDVNDDGEVNIADINSIINIILNQ